MADWDDDETTNVGRSFSNFNLNSSVKNANNNNDTDWGNEGNGHMKNGGGGVAAGDDDNWGNEGKDDDNWGDKGHGNGNEKSNWNHGGRDRRDFGGNRRGGGGGGYGGGYNRGRPGGENGVDTATPSLHDSNSVTIKIPSDFEKSTVERFLHNLNLTDYSTLFASHELRKYLLEAYKVHVEKEMDEVTQEQKLQPITRINVEELDQEMRELDQLYSRLMKIIATSPSTVRAAPRANNAGVEPEFSMELLDALANIPDLPNLMTTDVSSIRNSQVRTDERNTITENPRIITSTRQRRPPERLSVTASILEEQEEEDEEVTPRRNGMQQRSRNQNNRDLANAALLQLGQPFQVREPRSIPQRTVCPRYIRNKVEFRANNTILVLNPGIWHIADELSDTSFESDQIFEVQQNQISVDLARPRQSTQEGSGASGGAVGVSLLVGNRALQSSVDASLMIASRGDGDAAVAYTPLSTMSLANRQPQSGSSGSQTVEVAMMQLPPVENNSLLGSAGSTPAAPPAGLVTPSLSSSKRLKLTSNALPPPPTASAGASASSFLHRQNLSLIREEDLERSRRQLVKNGSLSPRMTLYQRATMLNTENLATQEETPMTLLGDQMAAVHVSINESKVPAEGATAVETQTHALESQQPPSVPVLLPSPLIEQARRALRELQLSSLPLIPEVDIENLQPLMNSTVLDTPPEQRTDRGSYRRNWFNILRNRQLQFNYVDYREQPRRPRRFGTQRRRAPPCPLVDSYEHIMEGILPPLLHGREQQLLTPDRTAPDEGALLNETVVVEQQQAVLEAPTSSLEEGTAKTQSDAPATTQPALPSCQFMVNELDSTTNASEELPTAKKRQRVEIIEDILIQSPIAQAELNIDQRARDSAAAAQELHDTFVLEHHGDISLLMENLPLVRDLMVEYHHSLVTTRAASNSDGTEVKSYPTLPANYCYDADLLLNADPNKLRVKHGVLKALVCQQELNLKRADFVRNRMDAAIAFGFLLELKGERDGGGRFGGGDGGRKFGGRRRDDDDFNNNNAHELGEDGENKKREFYIPPEPTNDENEMFTSGIASGINFAKYENIPIKVSGKDVPPPIRSFNNAGLREIVLENVQKSGYMVPTPIQKVAVPVITAGRDLMACAQTGSGKTAAFLLPILSIVLEEGKSLEIGKPHAVIVSPTRELAIQIYNEARKFAYKSYLKICILYGGTSFKYQNENFGKGCHILIATPGRLIDFVNRAFVLFDDTRFVVLDEADRMLDMGFLESVKTIMRHPTMSKERQTLMFSATFPEDIQRLAGEFLFNYVFAAIGVIGGACADVKQQIVEVNKFNKRAKLLELLHENADGTIVFVETKRGADFLASFFSETEFPTTSIHGDRLQSQREMALRDFKSGKMKVLIATSVASRGLDIKNVKHVINYDMPTSIDDYVHRIGRTGRVGNRGRATSFFDSDSDYGIANDLVKIMEGSNQEVPDFLRALAGSGDGDDYTNNRNFGGVDVRGKQSTVDAFEAEQDWE